MDKLISVVIPTFDRQELTLNAIKSIACAIPSVVEIVVVDDCGTIPFVHDDKVSVSGIEVCIFRLPINVGAGMARKFGVENARGRYIAFLDSDDSYDPCWMDYVIFLLREVSPGCCGALLISGITIGEKPFGAAVRKMLATLPRNFQLSFSRMVAVMFNPFYTPSIVLDKKICAFKDELRHCEDYYTTAVALFQADMILLPQMVACHLGRVPNSEGGESSSGKKMYRGEMTVRRAMLGLLCVPFGYKLLVPVGMLYQMVRAGVKLLTNKYGR